MPINLIDEWDVRIVKEDGGAIFVTLCQVDDTGQYSVIDSEAFGPFDTALEVIQWLVRHWAPRAKLPLR